MRSLLLGGTTAAVLVLTVVFAAVFQAPATTNIELAQLNEANWSRFVPEGKEVDAIYGDFVLRNQHLTAVIAQPLATRHANMTTKDVGGCLIDLTVNDASSDQLTAFYPGKKGVPYRAVKPAAAGALFNLARVAMETQTAADFANVTTTYQLGFEDRWLTVQTEYRNPHAKPVTVLLGDDFRADGGKEDMVRTPNGVAERFWLHDRHWGQAYGLDTKGRKIQSNSDARTSQLAYVDETGEAKVTIAPGEKVTIERRIYPGRNVFDIHAIAQTSTPDSTVPAKLTLRDAQQRPLPDVRVELFRGEESYGVARTDAQGQLATRLPPGEYRARCSVFGNTLGADRPLTVTKDSASFDLKLDEYNYGTLTAAITDERGQPIPCKVELKPQADGVKLDFGPETGEFAVRNLRYTPDGKFAQALPPGKYDVVVSHGPEFDAVFTEVTVPANGAASLAAKLVRSVDTTGWVSSDFHSHASPSGDNSSSQLGRVLNLVCEHVEFAPCTEHNRVTTYQPHIDRLGIAKFISSVEGIELTGTPLPLNHQNAFPMKFTPRTQDGGGPTTATNLEDQIERLALWDDRSEKLVQVNHPDLGWMFYDKDGDGKPDAGHERGFPYMDVIEIHPIDNALKLEPTVTFANGQKFHNTVFRWLQLLNQGFRSYGVVNTDAHYNFHGSGALRNWIQSTTDEPSQLKYMDLVHASEQGRLVMSNGPFLEVWAQEAGQAAKVTAGQDLAAKSGKVAVKIRVQCPNWFDVDRVQVLVNGRIRPELSFTREQNPDAFRSTALKFDRTVEVPLSGDAHLIVITGNPNIKLSKVFGPGDGNVPPAAMSNPIFVDVDGNGFQANKDTLDAPLPVKFGAGG